MEIALLFLAVSGGLGAGLTMLAATGMMKTGAEIQRRLANMKIPPPPPPPNREIETRRGNNVSD